MQTGLRVHGCPRAAGLRLEPSTAPLDVDVVDLGLRSVETWHVRPVKN